MEIPKKLRDNAINFVLLQKQEPEDKETDFKGKGKAPIEAGWQNKEIKWDSKELQDHLAKGWNYGVMGGGDKHLIALDFDNEELQELLIPKLPKTFTVKAGGGLLHKYFFSDKSDSFKIWDEHLETLIDIQGKGKQVVGAGCQHPNNNYYEVVDDSDIAFIPYSEIEALIKPHDKKPKREVKKKEVTDNYDNDFLGTVKSNISFESVLSTFGVDTSKNPTNCPSHASKGGKCLGWTDEVAHCFHCDESWNMFSFVMHNKNLDFNDALEWLCENNGMEDDFKKHREEWKKTQRAEKLGALTDKSKQAKIFAEAQPYFYDKNKLWWLWDSEAYKWELVDEVDVLNMITISCGQDIITSKARTETLNALKQEGRLSIPKPIKPTWIQFKNKIIDIETAETFEATPEYFVTNPIPYQMGEYPDTPNMDRIFEEWVGKKYVPLLYEILSYALIPAMPIQRIFCFLGAGMNGKSKFLELLRKFVGKDNCCSTELDTLLTSRFEVTRLHKKLICEMGETNFNEMNKTSILKKLAGGDLIGFEYKNKNPFEEHNYAKIIIATNNLPTTSDKTLGFYRRWCIIDFPNTFSEKKDILADIPEQEYEALALKSVVILKGLLEAREFTNEGSIEERMERYEAKSNFLEKFIHENTKEELNGYITSADFYKKFKEWCKINRHRDMTERAVGMALKKFGWESGKKHFDWMYDGKGGQARCWFNVKWKEI